MDIKVSVETSDVSRFMRRLFRDQLPFSTSKAINEVAKDFQREQRRHQREIFTVRNARFVDRSVKIRPFSNKRTLEARVSIDPPGGRDRADILTKFEDGGFKFPRGRHLTVPQEVKRTKRGIIGKARRPRAFGFELRGRGPKGSLFQGAKKTFMIVPHAGGGAIFKQKRGQPFFPLFSLTRRARIPASLDFQENARQTVDRRFEMRFSEAFDRAIRTAR